MTKPWNTKEWRKRRKEILKARNKCEWCGLTQDESLLKYGAGLVIDHLWKNMKWERYIELRDQDVRVLCKKCNMKVHKGYELCPVCRTNFMERRYLSISGMCYSCREAALEISREQDIREERRRRDFDHGLEHPELRHLKLWHCGECGEPIDFQHFCAYQMCDPCLDEYYAQCKKQDA